MSRELVSVVIITYKRPIDILKRAILSVVNQTYKHIEIIIVNDAPEEKELCQDIQKMIKTLDDTRVYYYEQKKNSGANVARNKGLRVSVGSFIGFLDDDDEWDSQKVELQLRSFDRECIALVYGPFVSKTGSKMEVYYPPLPGKKIKQKILEGNFIGGTSFPLIRTRCIKEVGGFDINLISCQEYELWIRLIEKYEINYCSHILGVYYSSVDSTFKSFIKYMRGIDQIIEKHKNIFSKYPISYGNRFNNMAFELIQKHRWKDVLYYKKRAYRACIFNPSNLTTIYIIKRCANKLFRKIRKK